MAFTKINACAAYMFLTVEETNMSTVKAKSRSQVKHGKYQPPIPAGLTLSGVQTGLLHPPIIPALLSLL